MPSSSCSPSLFCQTNALAVACPHVQLVLPAAAVIVPPMSSPLLMATHCSLAQPVCQGLPMAWHSQALSSLNLSSESKGLNSASRGDCGEGCRCARQSSERLLAGWPVLHVLSRKCCWAGEFFLAGALGVALVSSLQKKQPAPDEGSNLISQE